MAQRFTVGWMRLIPFLGYHHVLMILLFIAIICFSIVVAGCTTTSLSSVYLVSLAYARSGTELPKPDLGQSNPNITSTFAALASSANETHLEVRASYFGICIKEMVGDWICSSSIFSLANLFRSSTAQTLLGSGSNGEDPLNLIWIAGKFKSEIVFSGLILTALPLAFIAILLMGTFPGWHEETDESGSDREVKPFPSRAVSQICLSITFISAIFQFVSAFWQHIAAAATSTMNEVLSYGAINAHVGMTSMGLAWTAFGLTGLVTIGLLVMILSIRVMSEAFG